MKETPTNLRNTVIQIDTVDYLIRPNASDAIKRGEEYVTLLRIKDKVEISTRLTAITKSLKKTGVIDTLKKRQGSL